MRPKEGCFVLFQFELSPLGGNHIDLNVESCGSGQFIRQADCSLSTGRDIFWYRDERPSLTSALDRLARA